MTTRAAAQLDSPRRLARLLIVHAAVKERVQSQAELRRGEVVVDVRHGRELEQLRRVRPVRRRFRRAHCRLGARPLPLPGVVAARRRTRGCTRRRGRWYRRARRRARRCSRCYRRPRCCRRCCRRRRPCRRACCGRRARRLVWARRLRRGRRAALDAGALAIFNLVNLRDQKHLHRPCLGIEEDLVPALSVLHPLVWVGYGERRVERRLDRDDRVGGEARNRADVVVRHVKVAPRLGVLGQLA
mmetsp:Transcript_58041/g.126054  ORF Transcript_58041/g.126054 Transcript_58041/m.126054 type:complete len:243 (-) Transcript_58041:634-1362(-)